MENARARRRIRRIDKQDPEKMIEGLKQRLRDKEAENQLLRSELVELADLLKLAVDKLKSVC